MVNVLLAASGFSRWLIDNFEHFKQSIVWLLVVLIVLLLWEAASWAHHKKMTAPLGGVPGNASGGTGQRPAGGSTHGMGPSPGPTAAGASMADEDPFKALMQARPPTPPAALLTTGIERWPQPMSPPVSPQPSSPGAGAEQDLLSASSTPPVDAIPPAGDEGDPWKALMQQTAVSPPAPRAPLNVGNVPAPGGRLDAADPAEWMSNDAGSSPSPPPSPARRPLDLRGLSASPSAPETAGGSDIKQFLRDTLGDTEGAPHSALPLNFPTAPPAPFPGPPAEEPSSGARRPRALDLGESLRKIKDAKGDSPSAEDQKGNPHADS